MNSKDADKGGRMRFDSGTPIATVRRLLRPIYQPAVVAPQR